MDKTSHLGSESMQGNKIFVQAPFCLPRPPFSILKIIIIIIIIPNQLLARTLYRAGIRTWAGPEQLSGAMFAIWRHCFCNNCIHRPVLLQKAEMFSKHGREKMESFTESKVSGPKTDGPANYMRFLPPKTSCPRLLVPGSHTLLGPLTFLGTLVAIILPKPWRRVPGDSRDHPALSSISQPTNDSPNLGVVPT